MTTSETISAARARAEPRAPEARPLLPWGAPRRLLLHRGDGGPESPAHASRPRQRARADAAGGLWTNVPVTEPFAAQSPYVIHRTPSGYFIRYDGHDVAPVRLSPRPDWYDARTATGKPMTRIGTLQGTYLGIYQAKVCEYWTAKPQKVNCKFCSVGLNLGVDDADEKSVAEVMEVRPARARRVGHHLRRLQHRALRRRHLPGHPGTVPRAHQEGARACWSASRRRRTATSSATTRCVRMGLNRVSFCFEIFDQETFSEHLPGQARGVRPRLLPGGGPLLRRAGPEGPATASPWVTNGEIIAGLEPPGVVHPRHRLDHVRGRHSHRLRVPSAGGHRPRARGAAPDGGDGAGVPPALRGVHGSAACRSAARPTST